jgi:hypothetical protein
LSPFPGNFSGNWSIDLPSALFFFQILAWWWWSWFSDDWIEWLQLKMSLLDVPCHGYALSTSFVRNSNFHAYWFQLT